MHINIMFLISFNQVFPNLQIRALFFPNFADMRAIFPKFNGPWPEFQIGRKIPVYGLLVYQLGQIVKEEYSRLLLPRNPRDSMKHFEISVLQHIRFAELGKTINPTTTFNRMSL